jgi:hypothetical protein
MVVVFFISNADEAKEAFYGGLSHAPRTPDECWACSLARIVLLLC